jgi:hypothetical protein
MKLSPYLLLSLGHHTDIDTDIRRRSPSHELYSPCTSGLPSARALLLQYIFNFAVNAAHKTPQFSPDSLYSNCTLPVPKMALEKDVLSHDIPNSKNDPILDSKVESGSNVDLEAEKGIERSKYGSSDKSVGGRIAPVLPHLRGYDFGSDDSGSDILGKQIELEAGNAIQYRTCSWPKASPSSRLDPTFEFPKT